MTAAADPFSLAGRSIILTGGGGGLAAHLAGALAARGGHVVLTDVDDEALSRATGPLPGALAIRGDTTRPDDMHAVMAACAAQFGTPDVLINCAAIGCHTPPEELSLNDWQRVIDIDLTGYFVASREFARTAIAAGRSASIINLSSIAGPSAIGRGNIAYSVAKAGIDGMTRELAIEWAGFGIRVNSIQPCQIATKSLLDLIRTGIADEAELVGGIPLGRIARVEDLVGPVVFLASSASDFVTGICLPVDGGNLAMNAGASLRGPAGARAAPTAR